VADDEEELLFVLKEKLNETKKMLFQAGTIMEVKRLQHRIAFFNEKILEIKKNRKKSKISPSII